MTFVHAISARAAASRLAVLALSAMCACGAESSSPSNSPLISSGDSVFFVGNSFMGGPDNRLTNLVRELGTVVQPTITIHDADHVVYGNQPLAWFFAQPESQDAINSGQYDVFILQGEEREPVDHPEDFKQAVRDYHAAITQHGGRVMLFMTWEFAEARDESSEFFPKLVAAYEDIGEELDVPVIPIGLIYDDANRAPYDDQGEFWLLLPANEHQNDLGSAVNAYAVFGMLTGINPLGVQVPGLEPIKAGLRRYLSDLAWARVSVRLPQR